MARVALDGVSKVYPGGATAVDNLNLEVQDRELLVLVGPSGCGKTTTLRMIAGLEEVSRGEIYIGDRAIAQVAPKDRDIAMVFQNYALYPHMTVRKNMAFGLQLRYGGLLNRIWKRLTAPADAAKMAAHRKQIGSRVRQTAQILGIEHLLARMPRQLSGGERQRVALGRAIVRDPAAFLFDEPLSNLDAKLRVEMRRELKQLHQRLAATMIYVTHDQVEAMTLGQRIAVMHEGKLQQVGTPREVYDEPKNQFVAGFIGAPPMNFIAGKISKREEAAIFAGSGIEIELTNQTTGGAFGKRLFEATDDNVILGIRAEDVTVHADPRAANNGKVSAIEELGDQSIVQVEIADAAAEANNSRLTLSSKTMARTSLQPGDEVALEFAAARIHLFDAQTGANLRSGE